MPPVYYLSGRTDGTTQVFQVHNRTVEQTAELGRLLGLEEATIIVALWPKDSTHVDFYDLTSSVRLALWPGRIHTPAA